MCQRSPSAVTILSSTVVLPAGQAPRHGGPGPRGPARPAQQPVPGGGRQSPQHRGGGGAGGRLCAQAPGQASALAQQAARSAQDDTVRLAYIDIYVSKFTMLFAL